MVELPGYQDVTVIARGRFSTVYRADPDDGGRPVAVKVHQVALPSEIATTVRLGAEHPHITTVVDSWVTEDGRPYTVMEHHDRGSLHDRLLGHGVLPTSEVVAVGIAVSDALSYAHQQGVLHRDIKPQNVLVLPESYVVADFATSRGFGGGAPVEWFTHRHTASQVLDGEPPAEADDLWSVGALLFTLLDGQPPFAWEGIGDAAGTAYERRVRAGSRRPLWRTDVPPGLVTIIDRCLRRERAARFPDAAALRDALASLPAVASAAPEPGHAAIAPNRVAPDRTPPEPGRRSRRARILVNSAVALVLGGAIGLTAAWTAGRSGGAARQPAAGPAAGAPSPNRVPAGSPSPAGVRSTAPTASNLNNPAIAPVITGIEAAGTGVVVRWRDTTGSEATFIVIRVVDGKGTPVSTLPPGTTQVVVEPAAPPYCFLVIAVMGHQRGVSPTVCAEG